MENSILIFRTSITEEEDIKRIGTLFAQYSQIHEWSVDFEDWEKVLRIECREISPADISSVLQTINIDAAELEH